MASNPYNNKVQLADGTVLIDLTQDTVSPGRMVAGTTAHDKSGAVITGQLFQIGDCYASKESTNPATVLGFGTWMLIRKPQFTWGDAKSFTWGELKQDTWNWELYAKNLYIWVRTA